MDDKRVIVVGFASGGEVAAAVEALAAIQKRYNTDRVMLIESGTVHGAHEFKAEDIAKLEARAASAGVPMAKILELALGFEMQFGKAAEDRRQEMHRLTAELVMPDKIFTTNELQHKKPRPYGQKKWHAPPWYERKKR